MMSRTMSLSVTPLVAALLVLGGMVCCVDNAAAAPQYLERVESPVYETEGDHQAISRRALTCIAQIVRPGLTDAPTVLSSDLDAGVIVANNAFKVTTGLFDADARTTLTFEAKDGRFRITHTNVEQFLDAHYGWTAVPTARLSLGDKVQAGAQLISEHIAACVMGKSPSNNW